MHSPNYPSREQITALMASTALLLGGAACSQSRSESPQQSDQATEQPSEPMETAEIGEDNCAGYSPSVYPGTLFKESRASSIQKQLDALQAAKTPNQQIGGAEIGNALLIVSYATVDNVYAAAFSYVNELPPDEFLTVDELLSRDFDVGAGDCLTRVQLRQVNGLFKTLVTGLGAQSGRQISAGANALYGQLEDKYDEFKIKYREELAEPN